MSGLQQPELHPLGVSNHQDSGLLDSADGIKDAVEHAKNGEDDTISTVSSELSDTDTLELLSLASRPATPATERLKLPRELGLSAPGWFSDFTDYDVITIHGLRDNHKTVWKSSSGQAWLQDSLFQDLSVRQLDYMYAIDDSARIFQPDGFQVEARNLLRLYAEKRRNLPETEINRPIMWVCHDIGGSIFKQVLIQACRAIVRQDFDDVETWEYIREARDRIVKFSTVMISLGCPHKTESIDRLEDEIHNLMSLPGPELRTGLVTKVKNIARQVDDINIRFLGANFFSRLLRINVFHLRSILPSANKPTNVEVSELVKNDSEVADAGTIVKGDKGEEGGQNEFPCETADGHGNADTRQANPTTPSSVNTQNEGIIDAEPEQNDTTDSAAVVAKNKKEALNSGEGSRKALVDHAFARASPFSRYTSCLFDMFERYNRQREDNIDHASLVKGSEDLADSDFDWVSYFGTKIREGYYVVKVNHDLNNCQLALLSMIPPVKPVNLHTDPELTQTLPFLDWIFAHERFKRFDESIGPYTLCIQGTDEDASRMAMISQHVYTRYESEQIERHDQEGAAFYFQFDKFDSRYNGIKPMLATFLSKLSWHLWSKPGEEGATHRLFESLEYYRNCCVEEERNCRTYLNYRLVIITSKQNLFPKNSIPETQMISLDECPAPLVGYAIDEKVFDANGLWPYLEHVLRKRPVLSALAESLKNAIEQCQAAPYLGYRILEWLHHFGRGLPVAEIAATVERLLPATPGIILSMFINALPPDKRVLALMVYRWVKYALEPLTVEALGHALFASTGSNTTLLDIDYKQLLREITVMSGGIIVVRDCFLTFSNDSFYDTSVSDGDDDEKPALIHGILAEACLKYLMHQEVLQLYDRLSVENYGGDVLKKPLASTRDSMLEYALALDFFHRTETRNRWAEAHYLLSNPFTRIHRGYVSSLPSMAALGLEDLVSRQVEQDQNFDWFHRDAWLAITEASRNGHESVVRKLLEHVQVEEPGLQDAITWANSSGDEGTLTRLLDSVCLLDSFSWPKEILSRAAACGSKPLISAITTAGVNLNERKYDTGEMAIHTAIVWGRQGVVKLLLDAEVDLKVRDNFGRTPLLLSADIGHPEIVQMLIKSGANADDKDTSGLSAINTTIYAGEHAALAQLLGAGADPGPREPAESLSESPAPLSYAAENCRLQCVRILLEKGANACIEPERGSPLYLLYDRPHVTETCRLLIERGANPNQVYSDKEMLLFRALRTEDKKLVGLLIDKGADVDLLDADENTNRKTPLGYAIMACSLEMMEFLLQKGASVNDVPEGAESSLFTASYWNTDIKKAELLLKHKADVHWTKSDGWTALHACYDMPMFVPLLLKQGADVNKMAHCGTLLMMAARWKFLDTLKILLQHRPPPKLDLKFDYDPMDLEYGMTALTIATSNPDDSKAAQKMMRDFLDRGAKVDHEDEDKNTALHGLTSSTPVKILKILADLGAPVDSPNQGGLTPLGVAVKNSNMPAAAYLISKGARADVQDSSFGNLLHLVCQQNYPEDETAFKLFKLLVGAGANLNSAGRDPARESLLHAVVYAPLERSARTKIVHYLVSHVSPAVDVNAPGGDWAYAIIAAARKGYDNILQYLVRHGANISVPDDLGRRPLHFLIGLGRWNSNTRPVRVLLKADVDIQAADKFGRTALNWAAGSRDLELFELILRKLPKGYNVNVRDGDGWTPLMWACRTSQGAPISIIDKLVNTLGADIFLQRSDGDWSAMKLACLSNLEEDIKKLLQPIGYESQQDGKDDSKEIRNLAFHNIPPAPPHSGRPYCDSCFAGIVGTRYKCTVCDDYDLCFKCFPSCNTMHDANHELKKYYEYLFVDEEDSDSPAEDDGAAGASESSEGEKPSTDTDDEVEYDSEVDD
ncbi:ankyrin repeat-containing domain protein [Colletotrichum phormii]|uniref:Ankyrin repeat-containing domain protein n=1 Tax=Colletotrichum phormii TaxID=359342 RepID=A0AAI9ZTL1_9PEZI|nr:ankyrin repeat-containing domain protein [Colletotrichum phormii]KAK1636422.1 ankyrin repeat-containing domain protein [Colletotrichum phormii]